MAYRKKTWTEKLAKEDGLPEIIKVKPADRARWGDAAQHKTAAGSLSPVADFAKN